MRKTTKMPVRTTVKAGGISQQHAPAVRSTVKAGGTSMQHAASLRVAASRR